MTRVSLVPTLGLVTSLDLSRQKMCTWRVFALIWSPVSQQLASFPGPKTGQAALRHFSVPECWVGPVNEATVVSRDYLSSCTSSTPCFLWAYSACVLLALLFERRGTLSHSILRVSFSTSVVCRVFRGSHRRLRELPYRLIRILRFTLGTWL